MLNTSKPIGIFGGAFDPIHYGHLRAALEVYQSLDLQQVRFVPCRQPVHKKLAIAAPEHRLAMLKQAIAKQPGFVIDDRELQRNEPSYTLLTLESIHQEVGSTPLFLILAVYAFAHFLEWYQWE